MTKFTANGALAYSTYLGGSGGENGNGIAVDGSGQAYVIGSTGSLDFPTLQASQPTLGGGGSDAFVTKFTALGALAYSTYLGGSGGENGRGIAVDGSGQAYVTGGTGSGDFPTLQASQPTLRGFDDAFVTKFTALGALAYSTYLGGSDGVYFEQGNGIAVDGSGQAYVTGITSSSDFPTVTPLQATLAGVTDAFVTKLTVNGALAYSTYLGGNNRGASIEGVEEGRGIAVDGAGQAYVTGSTPSSDFPTLHASQSAPGGLDDAFVTKLTVNGALAYSTYLGGSVFDYGSGIAVDGSGQAYVIGSTGSLDFPTLQASQPTLLGALAYSTYLGGSVFDYGSGIAVDGSGQAYVTGFTGSLDFPTLHASQPALRGSSDAFVTKITNTNLVNDLVTLVPVLSTYRTTDDPTGCPSGFVGTFSFDAWLTNKTSSPPLSDLAVQVKTLSNGNLLQNADGGPGGVGSTVTVLKRHGYTDGTLSRSEFVDVHFSICLKERKPFSFFVDVLGMRQE